MVLFCVDWRDQTSRKKRGRNRGPVTWTCRHNQEEVSFREIPWAETHVLLWATFINNRMELEDLGFLWFLLQFLPTKITNVTVYAFVSKFRTFLISPSFLLDSKVLSQQQSCPLPSHPNFLFHPSTLLHLWDFSSYNSSPTSVFQYFLKHTYFRI